MKMDIKDAINYASWYANHDIKDWNNRFVSALKFFGCDMVPWPERQQRPPGSIDAPLPLANAPDAWSGTYIIV